jgi:hypothetical protein
MTSESSILKNPEAMSQKKKWLIIGLSACLPLLIVLVISLTTSKGSSSSGTVADWLLFRELDLQTGRPSERLASLDGKKVVAPGFMVPLEDNRSEVTEFLLVPNPQACIHAPAPPSNQMVYIRMVQGPTKMVYGPVQVHGTLRVASQTHQYGNAGFQMYGEFVEPYRN